MASQRTCLVTGAAGFIGSYLSEALVTAGHNVVALDNFDPFYDPALKHRNIAGLLDDPRLVLVEGDIRDTELVAGCFQQHNPDAVVHLAARGGVRGSVADPLLYTDVNVTGTVTVLAAAAEHHVERFIFGSSSSVYGAANTLPFTEDQSVAGPISPYAASKVAAEAYCHTFGALYGLPVVCLRLFGVYGPRQRPDLAISKFYRLMLAGQALPVYGDGSASRDLTYVTDIVSGILAALQQPALATPGSFEIINLGSGAPVTVLELIRALEEILGCEVEIDWQPPAPGDVPHTWASIEKAKRVLGWQPTTSLPDGLAQFVQDLLA